MKHIHADLIKLFAEHLLAWHAAGADENTHPTTDWELLVSKPNNWQRFSKTGAISFHPDWQYRYNPLERTVTRYLPNGDPIELPEPMRTVPKKGVQFYVCANNCVYTRIWGIGIYDFKWFNQGLCHASIENARKWASYLRTLTQES